MTTILSWNIQFGRGVDNRIDLPRIRDDIIAMGDPDVICVQEVSVGFADVAQGADQAAELARLFPDHRALFPPALQWFDGPQPRRFGNGVLSRLPVTEVLSHPLPRPADGHHPHMQRQVIEVIVSSPLGPLRVATTHLEYYSVLQRRAQAQRLRELEAQWAESRMSPPKARTGVYEARPAPIGTVLCGDFNFPLDEATYADLQQPLGAGRLVDVWQLLGDGQPHAPTCGIYDHDQWPGGAHARDFFFVSADLANRVRRLETNLVTASSDHQPLLLTLGAPHTD